MGKKTHLKKKDLYRVFATSPKFEVDLVGRLIYFGPITGLDFEWNRPGQALRSPGNFLKKYLMF